MTSRSATLHTHTRLYSICVNSTLDKRLSTSQPIEIHWFYIAVWWCAMLRLTIKTLHCMIDFINACFTNYSYFTWSKNSNRWLQCILLCFCQQYIQTLLLHVYFIFWIDGVNFGTVKSLQNQCLRNREIVLVGLKSHPQHELAKRQMRGFSGMITCYIKGGLAESRAFLSTLKVSTLLPPIPLCRFASRSCILLPHAFVHKLLIDGTLLCSYTLHVFVKYMNYEP